MVVVQLICTGIRNQQTASAVVESSEYAGPIVKTEIPGPFTKVINFVASLTA